ncbi:MAG: hypothetical protein ACYC3X_13415 [Pirellulaceae bacterium]
MTTDFFDAKSSEWPDEQGRIRDAVADHEIANQSYLEEGVALLEQASQAADVFEKQPAGEKRRLLDCVLWKAQWANGELTPEFRQPFDMIAVGANDIAFARELSIIYMIYSGIALIL